jgi:hypothetical protein
MGIQVIKDGQIIHDDKKTTTNKITDNIQIPKSTNDSVGEPGSIVWDDNFLYYKTDKGWFRILGSSFQ